MSTGNLTEIKFLSRTSFDSLDDVSNDIIYNVEVPAVVIKMYVDGTEGYVVWSNGYCEQWGWYTGEEKTEVYISLLKEYKDVNYNVVCSQGAPGKALGYSDYTNSLSAYSTRQLYLNIHSLSATRSIYWHTYGFLADGEY